MRLSRQASCGHTSAARDNRRWGPIVAVCGAAGITAAMLMPSSAAGANQGHGSWHNMGAASTSPTGRNQHSRSDREPTVPPISRQPGVSHPSNARPRHGQPGPGPHRHTRPPQQLPTPTEQPSPNRTPSVNRPLGAARTTPGNLTPEPGWHPQVATSSPPGQSPSPAATPLPHLGPARTASPASSTPASTYSPVPRPVPPVAASSEPLVQRGRGQQPAPPIRGPIPAPTPTLLRVPPSSTNLTVSAHASAVPAPTAAPSQPNAPSPRSSGPGKVAAQPGGITGSLTLVGLLLSFVLAVSALVITASHRRRRNRS